MFSAYTKNIIPSDLPENFFNNLAPIQNDDDQITNELYAINYLEHWEHLAGILGSSQQEDVNFITKVMGILSIERYDEGFKVILDPSIYFDWVSKYQNANAQATLKRAASIPEGEEDLSQQAGDKPIPESKRRKSNHYHVDVNSFSHPKREAKGRSKRSNKSISTLLSISLELRNTLVQTYWSLDFNGNRNFAVYLDKLHQLTNTKKRGICASEIGYLDKNYMVNRLNIKEGLDELVKANGELSDDKVNKFYDVLTVERTVVGHLVFHHFIEENEIKIPAVEVGLEYRGRNYALLFFLHVFQYAQEHDVVTIKLETGHHENADSLKEELQKGMKIFYCKLGFRLDRETLDNWSKKSFAEKVECFKADNERCIFDSSEYAMQTVYDEALKTIYAYHLKRSLLNIVEEHSNTFRRTSTKYSVFELLAYEPYKIWLINQLETDNDLPMNKKYIEAALKILFYELKSMNDLACNKKIVDYAALNRAIDYRAPREEEKVISDKAERAKQQPASFLQESSLSVNSSLFSEPPNTRDDEKPTNWHSRRKQKR